MRVEAWRRHGLVKEPALAFPIHTRTPTTRRGIQQRFCLRTSTHRTMTDSSGPTGKGGHGHVSPPAALALPPTAPLALSSATIGPLSATPDATQASVPMPMPIDQELVGASAAAGGRSLAALMSMQTRPSPGRLAAGSAQQWCEPKGCCFDLASWPNAYGYQAQKKCVRCQHLHVLGQGESRAAMEDCSVG